MLRRVLTMVALAGAITPAGAAAQTQAGPTPEKSAALVYEAALQLAVEKAGQKLAQQVLMLAPQITLTTEPSMISSVKLPGWGYHFDVQAPPITKTSLMLEMMQQFGRPAGPGAATVASNSGRVAATGGPAADPMDSSPAPFDADRAYTGHVREALIDALLDSSAVLSLAPEERLTITASGIEPANLNRLYRVNSAKLVITITGADLQAFREGRMTREQAKERIAESRF